MVADGMEVLLIRSQERQRLKHWAWHGSTPDRDRLLTFRHSCTFHDVLHALFPRILLYTVLLQYDSLHADLQALSEWCALLNIVLACSWCQP